MKLARVALLLVGPDHLLQRAVGVVVDVIDALLIRMSEARRDACSEVG
jgi:hypothetical protein